MKDKKFIDDEVGETLLIPLYMKAKGTRMDKPIIVDELACRLIDSIDYDFKRFDKAKLTLIGTALRSTYFDKKLIDFINGRDNPVIIIIGCGLDGRVQRIGEIANNAIFYQLDIPEVMSIRQRMIEQQTNETNIAGSILATDWIDRIKSEQPDGDYLIIIEGVLMYFDNAQVKHIFQNLANNFTHGEFVGDITSVWASQNSHKHELVKLVDARFKLGINDDKEIETWASNLQVISSQLYSDFPQWHRTGIKGWLMKKIAKYNTANRLIHVAIGDARH